MLRRLNQKVCSWMACFSLRPHGYKATGGQTEPKPSDKLSIRNVVSPYFLPIRGEGSRKVSRRSAGMGVWRKRRPSCNGADRDKCPDTKVCRLPRGDLSQESLKNFRRKESKCTQQRVHLTTQT